MMATIPTTKEIKDRSLAALEASLNQVAPLNEKSFLQVLAAVLALNGKGHYALLIERAMQNLAITATGEDLDRIGAEYGLVRKAAIAASLVITLPADTGIIIPITVDYVGDSNGIRYAPTATFVESGGLVTSSVVAKTTGVVGNLSISDTMTIGTQIAGATTVATVTATTIFGADGETDEEFRERVLLIIRSTTGGGNAIDHKVWAESLGAVKEAYPYSGKAETVSPPGLDPASVPPQRTVFIESETVIDPDGIAPQDLLDAVREVINEDPDTGLARPALGLIDADLFVEAIVRTEFFVQITNLVASDEPQVKSEINDALVAYFLSIKMFIPGVDLPQNKNDKITRLTLSDIVQGVLEANSASATDVKFGTAIDVYTSDTEIIIEGELAKLGAMDGIKYA